MCWLFLSISLYLWRAIRNNVKVQVFLCVKYTQSGRERTFFEKKNNNHGTQNHVNHKCKTQRSEKEKETDWEKVPVYIVSQPPHAYTIHSCNIKMLSKTHSRYLLLQQITKVGSGRDLNEYMCCCCCYCWLLLLWFLFIVALWSAFYFFHSFWFSCVYIVLVWL